MPDEFNIKQELKYIREKVEKIESTLEKNYVTQDEFKPVQKIAWMLLTLVVGSAIGLMFYLGRSMQ